jgi:DNA replication licensing factor MCM3
MTTTNPKDPSIQLRFEQISRFIMQERQQQLWIMMERRERRFIINMDDLRTNEADLADFFLSDPINALPRLEEVLTQIVLDKDSEYFDKVAKHSRVFVDNDNKTTKKIFGGFEGNFGERKVTPRSLIAEHLSQLVCLEGIITKTSIVRPKMVRSVHYCAKTSNFDTREYRDATDLKGEATGSVLPTKDDSGNPYETEYGLCSYKDSQTFVVQEMPEAAPLGQLPRSVDVFVESDLVDLVKPGDRISVVGIYRALAPLSANKTTTGIFKTVLLANNIKRLGQESGTIKLTPDDIKNIKMIASDTTKSSFDRIARSLAPSIYGHKYVKQALALLLLGGLEHNLQNGSHIRGDINILMVGDPSTAKSQLLRFVLNIAPVAVNTTGRGSSGVGLTAAVTTDPETGERRLEAGAMVLADRGVVCIDEFDKMSDADRVAIHEVMEQQTVTIAKAGIQASLNARCSVVAAANPIYGRFDNSLPLVRNVSLPDSLLSRFDLVFIIRDVINKETDRKLAEHVLRMHRYQRPGYEGRPVPLDAKADDAIDEEDRVMVKGGTPIFQKYNPILHGGAAQEFADSTRAAQGGEGGGGLVGDGTKSTSAAPKFELMTLEFVRKFISYAKNTVQPRLSDGARIAIVNAYDNFRQKTLGRATVVTARSLETLIRLSTAHAKSRLSSVVQRRDVHRAVTIMEYALYADSGKTKRAEKAAEQTGVPITGAIGRGGGGGGGGDQNMPRSEGGGGNEGKEGEMEHQTNPHDRNDSQLNQRTEIEDDFDQHVAYTGSSSLAAATSTRVTHPLDDDIDAGQGMEDEIQHADDTIVTLLPEPSEIIETSSPEYIASVKCLNTFFRTGRKEKESANVFTEVWPYMKSALPNPFAQRANDLSYVMALLKAMENDNKILLIDGICHLVS